MPIVVTPVATLYSGYSILSTTNQALGISNPYNFNIPFTMIIDSVFASTNNTAPLAFSDVTGYTTYYPLVDRLNKPITGQELSRYAGKRRCLQCVYSPVYKTVKVLSCIDPIPLTVPSSTASSTSTN